MLLLVEISPRVTVVVATVVTALAGRSDVSSRPAHRLTPIPTIRITAAAEATSTIVRVLRELGFVAGAPCFIDPDGSRDRSDGGMAESCRAIVGNLSGNAAHGCAGLRAATYSPLRV